MSKKFLIADDHPAMRNGVKFVISSEFKDVEFGEAANAVEIFRIIKEKEWDLLILDLDMPGRNGLEVLKQIKDEGIKIPVIMFSMHPEDQIAIRALKLGASGYVAKDSAGDELVKAIDIVLRGKKYITPTLAERLAMQLENPSDKDPHELLSDREFETLLLIASGKTVSEISEQLSLSVNTISTYRTRILEKTGMKTTAELIGYALRNKLV